MRKIFESTETAERALKSSHTLSSEPTQPFFLFLFFRLGVRYMEAELKKLLKEKEKQLYEQVKSILKWLEELGDKVIYGTENEEQQAILEFLRKTLIVRRGQDYLPRDRKWITYYEFLLNTNPMVRVSSSGIGASAGAFVGEYAFVKCEWEWMLPAKAGTLIEAVIDYISELEEPPIP